MGYFLEVFLYFNFYCQEMCKALFYSFPDSLKREFVMKRIIYGLLLCLSFGGCKQEQDGFSAFDSSFRNVRKVIVDNCIKSDLLLGRPFFIEYADSCVFIYDDLGDSLFVMVDLAERNCVYRFGTRGQGNNEFLQVASLHRMASDSSICTYDFYRHALSRIDVRNVKQGIKDYVVLKKDSLNSIDMLPTKYGSFIGLGFYENTMFSLLRENLTDFFYEYPYRDSRERRISNRLRGMAYQGTLRSAPSLDKFVFAMNTSPIFMLYTIEKDKIVEQYRWIGSYPVYRTEETEISRSAPLDASRPVGFIYAYATDNYVYLLYSGKSMKDYQADAFTGNVIYQVDWKGNPVRKYVSDKALSTFCVSDSDEMIYAVAKDNEPTLVKIDLSK
ncbi:hypothetical protein B5F71_01810 [Bacteroides sp. An269]|nr:hypothetical protein B5G04_10740 [Bacteroides sp. An51A]OUO84435.1 hypothetical protein B5F71_01810 [Bacteroides sp. An269]OUP27263.1 hypothetical protein B5F25_19315 [Bacteroides sp. An19]